ncbi:MerR family transcriptional regulator, partial [Dorea sp. 210702-DFI.3.125]|nr:MerR family transcriptional regulator [Dorea sp. 210702-DFI.3.125]
MSKYYSIHEFSKIIGVSAQTLRNWDENGNIDNTEKSEQQELVEDLVQIITVFSCKLQGKRANKAKKLIRELIQEET